MGKQGKDLSLRVLAFQSLLAMSIALVVPFSARFTGEKIEIFSVFAYLFVGCIGIAAYQSITKVMKRIDELESRASEFKKPE